MSEGASSHLTARFERLRRKTPVVVLGTLVEGRREVVVVGESQGGLEESIFEIGSITKTFTALLLAEMCDSGEVALSDPLSKFISSMTRDNGIREITLLDLATHTARFPRVPRDLMWEALSNRSNPYARYHHDRLIEAVRHFRSRRGIGRRFRYSNFGFALLGYALEQAAGIRYDELIARRICGPLGLTSTSPSPSAQQASLYLTGHKRIGKPAPP
jgi:serine-type D-Ala-D-Ala carboxypeptidase/endopeptidase